MTNHQVIEREQIIDALSRNLAPSGMVKAAWLGGSEATGRVDALSDIDLCCIADDARVEDAINFIRSTLERLSPIELEWRLPAPTWHGHEQLFFRLRDVGPHVLIDTVVIKHSAPPSSRFLETERHGRARILFDPLGLVVAPALDRDAQEGKIRARLTQARLRFPMLQTIVIRAIDRGQPCEAAYFYMQLTLVPLVDALRIAHCPDRFDFGLRYLDRDLPPEIYARIRAIAMPGGLDEMRAAREKAEVLFGETLRLLDRVGR